MRRPPRRRSRIAVVGLATVLVVFLAGLGAGVALDQFLMQPAPATAVDTPTPGSVFDEAWGLIHDRYVDPSKIDDERLMAGAITGMLDTLGDQGHTRYLPPARVAQHNEDLSGTYVGVGIQIELRDDQVVVVAPLDDSPALQAGIRSGDVLTEVNGESVAGWTLEEVVDAVRGPEGSTVSLTFERPGEAQPLMFTLNRTRLALAIVDWVMLPDQIAHIRIREFNRGASEQLARAIQSAEDAGATSILLDLRNNPGGLVDEVISVSSQFLPPDAPIFISQTRDKAQVVHRAEARARRTSLPVVALVNQGTASAAEILSGALQQNHRGTIVGETTFGTGTVLSQYGLSDGSALLLGTELWLTPNGQLIKDHGITPDYTVTLPEDVPQFHPLSLRDAPDSYKQDTQVMAGRSLLLNQPLPEGVVPTGSGSCLRCT